MNKLLYTLLIVAILFGLYEVFNLEEVGFKQIVTDNIANNNSNDIVIIKPANFVNVQNPIEIIGKAKGNWFFEGVFPVVLTTKDKRVVKQYSVRAQGEWMNEGYVPFQTIIDYSGTEFKKGDSGYLIFKKSNPSGIPENDKNYIIEVVF